MKLNKLCSAQNMSARLMGKAQGSILCDTATFHASRSRIAFKTLPSILVKGKQEPIEVYTPLREVQQDSTAIARRQPEKFGSLGRAALLKSKNQLVSALAGSSSRYAEDKIVGRQKELKMLHDAIDWLAAVNSEMPASTPRPPSPIDFKEDVTTPSVKRGSDKSRKERLTTEEKREKRSSRNQEEGSELSSSSSKRDSDSRRHRRKQSSHDAKADVEASDKPSRSSSKGPSSLIVDDNDSTSSKEESTSTEPTLSASASMNDLAGQDEIVERTITLNFTVKRRALLNCVCCSLVGLFVGSNHGAWPCCCSRRRRWIWQVSLDSECI